jgi:hypothetical protein
VCCCRAQLLPLKREQLDKNDKFIFIQKLPIFWDKNIPFVGMDQQIVKIGPEKCIKSSLKDKKRK